LIPIARVGGASFGAGLAPLELRPLVIVRRHAEGLVSACSAFAPQLIAYADDQDGALGELTYFLSDYLAELPPDQLQKFAISEQATLRSISVPLTREDLPRGDRVRTPVELNVIVLDAEGGAKWVMLPTLAQVAYVPAERALDLPQVIHDEVLRLAAASDLDGTAYLDLLPAEGFELVRPLVAVELERGQAGKHAARARARRDAEKLLEKVGRKLLAPEDAVLGRNVGELQALLDGKDRLSVVLVGPEGCGKSAWLRAAAAATARPIYATSGAELVAGQSGLGQLEERIEAVVKACELLDAILYFDSLEDLFAGQTGGHEDIASLLRRPLQRGALRLASELTPESYDRLSQRHVGFFSYLQRFSVSALDRQQTFAILSERSAARVRRGKLGVDATGREQILALVERYEPYRVLPGKAVALFDELGAAHTSTGARLDVSELSADAVVSGFAAKSGVPAFLLRDERSLDVQNVEKFFREHVIGQSHAVRRVAETLCSVKAGLQPQGKPLATLLFVGPTGVGKTELSKALARFLFGSAERMARFDMSEYTDAYAADRLIRGTDRADGVLTRRVREQPFGVVLLDEIEKAHSSVFDLLLQVAGEGRLSDGRGKLAHFDNTILILTSNLGAQHRRTKVGFGDAAAEDDAAYYLSQVQRHFRPELVGRLDGIVSFSSLNTAQIQQVTRLSIERIGRRAGIEGRDSRLFVSEPALQTLVSEGFSAAYGARALRRYLEQALVAPLSSLISALGEQASGAVFLVQAIDETEIPPDLRATLSEHRPAQLPPVTLGRVRISAAVAGKRRREQLGSGVAAVARMRRGMRRWHALRQLTEARERLAELTIQLAQATRYRTPSSTLAELSREHGRLTMLLTPLDEALREVESIEGLLVGALDEVPPDLEPDALAQYERYRELLLRALFWLSEEDALCFAVQELDDRRVLHEFLLPFLRFAQGQAWETMLHFDRGAREGIVWPKVAERRWGPPIAGAQYLADVPAERPNSGVLVRVRGAGAGALLSFYLGRLRYESAGETAPGELWCRPLLGRYDVREEDWNTPRLSAVIDREVGRRQSIAWEEGASQTVGRAQLLERYASLFFTTALQKALAGATFLPTLPKDD
jgi:ATP-dependent Clp protease ATP-binding subunit ClpC